MNEWISVEERLPDKDGEYLVNVHQEDEERGLDTLLPDVRAETGNTGEHKRLREFGEVRGCTTLTLLTCK